MPNTLTASKQARAVRRGEAPVTPEYEVSGDQVRLLKGDTSHRHSSGHVHSTLSSVFPAKPSSSNDDLYSEKGSASATRRSTPLILVSEMSSSLSSSITEMDRLLATPLADDLGKESRNGVENDKGNGKDIEGDYFGRTTLLNANNVTSNGLTSVSGEGATSTSTSTSRAGSPAFGIASPILRRVFVDRSDLPRRPTFPPPSLSTYAPRPPSAPSIWERIHLILLQTTSFFISTTFLFGVVAWAASMEIINQVPRFLQGKKRKKTFPWDDHKYWKKNEKVSKHPRDYAMSVGMDIEDQTVETEDGYYLRVNKVIDPDARPKADGRGGFPVLILHGLFQSSGSFITSEDRSLAFWLAKQGGYQVYLGNNRGVFGMGHRNYSISDPRFWDWTIRELAMYDLPALVEHVCRETGYDKIAFVGHSQGNGLAFISLSMGMCPSLGKKLSLFVALAPAVYAGPLTSGFPFTQLSKIEWPMWKRIFGVLDFIPLMRWSYDYCPPKIFATMGYTMFAFLFNWTDANWLHRRKTKMFRFTPTPVSSASIFWWCGKGGFADRKCTLDDSLDQWFDINFPPLSIFYGGKDHLVLCDPLLERIEKKEKHVKLIRAENLEPSEVSQNGFRPKFGAFSCSCGSTFADIEYENSIAISTGLPKPSNGSIIRLKVSFRLDIVHNKTFSAADLVSPVAATVNRGHRAHSNQIP